MPGGENEALDDNGQGLGPCFRPAEKKLRQMNGLPVPEDRRILGDYLYWFDSGDQECSLTFRELDDEISKDYPKQMYGAGSPKSAAVTKYIKKIFIERFNIEYKNQPSTRESKDSELIDSDDIFFVGNIDPEDRLKEIGRKGEELVNLYLKNLKAKNEIDDYIWHSNEDPLSTMDFTIIERGKEIKMDVKSTEGDFEEPFYVSSVMDQIKEFAAAENDILKFEESVNFMLKSI